MASFSRLYLLLFILMLVGASGFPAAAQVRVTAQVAGTQVLPIGKVRSSHTGLHIGVGMEKKPLGKLSSRLGIGSALAWQLQDFECQSEQDIQDGLIRSFRCHNVRIPIVLSYDLGRSKSIAALYGGPFLLSRLAVRERQSGNVQHMAFTSTSHINYSGFFLGALAGARVSLSPTFRLFGEWQQDISKQRTAYNDFRFRTSTLLVGLEAAWKP